MQQKLVKLSDPGFALLFTNPTVAVMAISPFICKGCMELLEKRGLNKSTDQQNLTNMVCSTDCGAEFILLDDTDEDF